MAQSVLSVDVVSMAMLSQVRSGLEEKYTWPRAYSRNTNLQRIAFSNSSFSPSHAIIALLAALLHGIVGWVLSHLYCAAQ